MDDHSITILPTRHLLVTLYLGGQMLLGALITGFVLPGSYSNCEQTLTFIPKY
jgi:flagellar biosynthesis protein FliQ